MTRHIGNRSYRTHRLHSFPWIWRFGCMPLNPICTRDPHCACLAILTHQAALSQSLPRSYRTSGVWPCSRFPCASFRDYTWVLVHRFLLGLDAVPDTAASKTRRRDGCRGRPDFQRTLEQPRRPCWLQRGFGNAIRIVEQTRSRCHALRLSPPPFSSST